MTSVPVERLLHLETRLQPHVTVHGVAFRRAWLDRPPDCDMFKSDKERYDDAVAYLGSVGFVVRDDTGMMDWNVRFANSEARVERGAYMRIAVARS